MSADDIRSMPAGPEFDALAATLVMGWKADTVDGLPNTFETPGKGYGPEWRNYYPSKRIADAFLLVDKLLEEGWRFRLDMDCDADGGRPTYSMEFFKDAAVGQRCPGVGEHADTAALAITRAACLVKMEEN